MSSIPGIENRKQYERPCKCGKEHNAEIVQGIFHYKEENFVIYIACLLEHDDTRYLWIGFISGAWPDIDSENCLLAIKLFLDGENVRMIISPDDLNPFTEEETADAYILSRDEILAQDGAKDWIIENYQLLLEADPYLWEYVVGK